ncbi:MULTISPECIES: hypothetical protein [Pelosinus]|uniref:Glycosyl transferase group 1 n=1 Tax=Pelosinus fermentans B4 TaxID=1149862 RepID=I8REK5_9FIRM|nr:MULTISPECIES: hypothetical protein [Pelosinus]EIW16025.1 hypothetical protein FB4_1714 [Pelosinus fermentans B4]EIW27269.1 hypothetical protein FA11_1288 [Pelosinus fermentans A11]
MRRVFYLTRSYLPDQSGGILMRVAAVNFLRDKGYQVIVVTPGSNNKIVQQDDIWYIPHNMKLPKRLSMKLNALYAQYGIYEDYLDPWVKQAYDYLKGHLSNDDIIFATCGGELGNIKLGSLLKRIINCKFIVNFRDPLNHSLVNNMKTHGNFYVSREENEKKYLSNADMIVTSNQSHLKSLKTKYPELSSKLTNNYFGYMEKANLLPRQANNELKIAYSGTFTATQRPEILAQAIEALKRDNLKLQAYFIGQYQQYPPIFNYTNQNMFIPFMPHAEYVEFMLKNIDVGLISLADDYFGACVPSKLYEYINLGIPIIGALPEGDAMDIINKNQYGIACRYDDNISLQNAIRKMTDRNIYNEFRKNILRDRDIWFMGERIKEVVGWMQAL